MATPTDPPVANHVVTTSFVEEPAAPPAEESSNEPAEGEEVEQKSMEERLPAEGEDVPSPEPPAEPEAPTKEMQQLEITAEDEKEVDTAELPVGARAGTESSEAAEAPQEDKTASVEESNAPTEEEEDQYKHLKVTVTLPEQHKVGPEEENGEKPADKDHDEKKVPDKAKDDKERDSDSGTGSAADNSSVDLNLSISSFLSKTKEPGSVSIQVTHTVRGNVLQRGVTSDTSQTVRSCFLKDTKRQKKTLKKTRKFIVDGVEVKVTTSKIISDNDTKNEEMRFLR